MKDNSAIRYVIKKEREQLGITQEELCEMLHNTSVAKWERGICGVSQDYYEKLEEIFNLKEMSLAYVSTKMTLRAAKLYYKYRSIPKHIEVYFVTEPCGRKNTILEGIITSASFMELNNGYCCWNEVNHLGYQIPITKLSQIRKCFRKNIFINISGVYKWYNAVNDWELYIRSASEEIIMNEDMRKKVYDRLSKKSANLYQAVNLYHMAHNIDKKELLNKLCKNKIRVLHTNDRIYTREINYEELIECYDPNPSIYFNLDKCFELIGIQKVGRRYYYLDNGYRLRNKFEIDEFNIISLPLDYNLEFMNFFDKIEENAYMQYCMYSVNISFCVTENSFTIQFDQYEEDKFETSYNELPSGDELFACAKAVLKIFFAYHIELLELPLGLKQEKETQ